MSPVLFPFLIALLLPALASAQEGPASKPSSRPASRKAGKPGLVVQPRWITIPNLGRFQVSGAAFTKKNLPVFDPAELVKNIDKLAGKPIRLRGTVHKTCAKKGCWMWVRKGDAKIYVRFKDYAFFVPKKGAEGRPVFLEGVAKKTKMSVEMARHLAEDAGDHEAAKKITKPVDMIQVTATAVMIQAKKAPKTRKAGADPASRPAGKRPAGGGARR